MKDGVNADLAVAHDVQLLAHCLLPESHANHPGLNQRVDPSRRWPYNNIEAPQPSAALPLTWAALRLAIGPPEFLQSVHERGEAVDS